MGWDAKRFSAQPRSPAASNIWSHYEEWLDTEFVCVCVNEREYTSSMFYIDFS